MARKCAVTQMVMAMLAHLLTLNLTIPCAMGIALR